jgi:hypothetical protein
MNRHRRSGHATAADANAGALNETKPAATAEPEPAITVQSDPSYDPPETEETLP